MAKYTVKTIREWYENQSDDVRMILQSEFGNHDLINREHRFYQWLINEKKWKIK